MTSFVTQNLRMAAYLHAKGYTITTNKSTRFTFPSILNDVIRQFYSSNKGISDAAICNSIKTLIVMAHTNR